MMVAAMALFLVIILASPFQTYLNRRASVANSERQQRQLAAEVAQLQAAVRSCGTTRPTSSGRLGCGCSTSARATRCTRCSNAQGQPLTAEPAPSGQQVVRAAHPPSWNSTLWTSVRDASK